MRETSKIESIRSLIEDKRVFMADARKLVEKYEFEISGLLKLAEKLELEQEEILTPRIEE